MPKVGLETEPFKLSAVDLGVSAYVGETNFVDVAVKFGGDTGHLRLTMDHDRFLAFAGKVVEEAQKVIRFKMLEHEALRRADKVPAKLVCAKGKKVNPGSTKKVKRKKRKWSVIND